MTIFVKVFTKELKDDIFSLLRVMNMNCIKKLYCRIFQLGLRASFPVLPYREPVLIADGCSGVAAVLGRHRCHHPLIVTDAGIRKNGITAILEKALSSSGVTFSVYDKVVANPTTDNVAEALNIYKAEGCDCLIGIGGGSSMDTAKAVGARLARPGKSLARMKGILKVMKRLPLLIAIPTTAGTGSETTLAAVIVDSETRHKYAINDFPLIPRYAVLDPELTRSLPPFLTASTGLDALTHAVEAYIGRSTTSRTRKQARVAVRLIFQNLEKAYTDGDDLLARASMLRASYLAGCAFTKSYVGYVHAVAHSLGGAYNTPHGLANAVLLPYVLESYGKTIEKKLFELAVSAGVADELTPRAQAASDFIQAVRELEKKLSVPDNLEGIRTEDIPSLAHYADKEANPLYPVPVLMNAKELEKFYYMVRKDS